MKITSYWQAETGFYDEKVGRYTRRRFTDIKEKVLETEIRISEYNNQPVLQFIGGPTGYESYYLSDLIPLLDEPDNERKWVICAGTINSWPRCWVKIGELKKVIQHFKEDSPHWTDKHITVAIDDNNEPIFTAWDESGANNIGEFSTHEKAKEALIEYAKTLN
jgi:hypothetical protein